MIALYKFSVTSLAMYRKYMGRKGMMAVVTALVLSMGSAIIASAEEPEKRTKEEIVEYYKEHPYDTNSKITFEEEPSFSPYTAGKLSEASVTDGLNALNFVRYIAGIPDDITINSEYEELAQTGSVVMAKNQELAHKPIQPEGMPDEFYQKGYSGTSQSNIGMGYANISSSIINGYMDDGNASNIDRVGHRRWCLNPNMTATGFGYFQGYTALYSFDSKRENCNIDYVVWPAQTMPVEIFEGPWSVQISKDTYKVVENDIQVKLSLIHI